MQRENESTGVHKSNERQSDSAHTNANAKHLAFHCTISRSLKYSCSSACLAVILLLGSYRSIFCQQTEIGEFNTVRIYDAAFMIINRTPFDLPREGPNQQVQDLGQLLPGPGMNAQTGDFSGIGYIYGKHKL